MFPLRIRILILLIDLVLIVTGLIINLQWIWLLALVQFGLLSYGYFRYGSVYAAFQQLKKQNIDRAEKLYAETFRLEWLDINNRTYYYFGMAAIYMEREKWDRAATFFRTAMDMGGLTLNDKAIGHLNLAEICLHRENPEEAKDHLNAISALPYKEKLQEYIDSVREKYEEMRSEFNTGEARSAKGGCVDSSG